MVVATTALKLLCKLDKCGLLGGRDACGKSVEVADRTLGDHWENLISTAPNAYSVSAALSCSGER